MVKSFGHKNKKTLKDFDFHDIMNKESMSNKFNIETDLPEEVKGNAQWVKDLYYRIEARPAIDIVEKKKKENLRADFLKEAGNIGKLDLKTREMPHIQEYMNSKYDNMFIPTEVITGTERKMGNDNFVAESSILGVDDSNYGITKSLDSFESDKNIISEKNTKGNYSEEIKKLSFNENEFRIPTLRIEKNKTPFYGPIRNQNDNSMKGRYLKDCPISNVGCEVIAIHNALYWIDGKGKDFNDVIEKCEKIVYPTVFPVVGDGMFGCNPNRIGEVLDDFGVKYNKATQYQFAEELVKNSEIDDVYIISYWNDERPSNGLHTVAFKVTDDLRGEKVLRALNVRAGSGTYGGFDIFVKNEMGSNEKQFIVLYKLTQV